VTRPARSSDDEIARWLGEHDAWRLVDGHLVARYELAWERSLEVLALAGAAVTRLNHHPVVGVQYGALDVELWTHDRGGVTALDLAVAEAFDAAVAATR
jgi:4a-hydroxytetrahydrobiopterin dehydratase